MPKFEYGIIVKTIQITHELADMNGDEVSQSLLQAFGPAVLNLQSAVEHGVGLPGGQVVSHTLTRIDRYLIATFLVRRQKS